MTDIEINANAIHALLKKDKATHRQLAWKLSLSNYETALALVHLKERTLIKRINGEWELNDD